MPRMTLGGEKKQPSSRYGALFNKMGSYAESESKPETPETVPAPVEETVPVTTQPVTTAPEVTAPVADEDNIKALQANLEQPAPVSDAYSYGYDDGDYEEEYEDTTSEVEEAVSEEAATPDVEETSFEDAEPITEEAPEPEPESIPAPVFEEPVETESTPDELVEEALEVTDAPAEEETPFDGGGIPEEEQEEPAAEVTLTGAEEIQVIIDLYEAIRNLTPEDREALNALLGNHTDSTPAQTILSIVEDAERAEALLKAVSELATVDTSNPNRAVAKYVILLSKHTDAELQSLNAILHDGEPEIVTEDNRDEVLETLAITLATTPPNVFGAAHTISSIIE